MIHAKTALCAGVLVGLAAFAPMSLAGQAGPEGTFVAVPDAFPPVEARAVVVREGRREVILLRDDEATIDALSIALLVLKRARERDPSPGHGQMIPITGFAMTQVAQGEELRRLEGVLRRLAAAPIRRVGNLGPGRWVRLR